MTLAEDVFRGDEFVDDEDVDDARVDGDGDLDGLGDDRYRFEDVAVAGRKAGGDDVGGVGGLTSFILCDESLGFKNNHFTSLVLNWKVQTYLGDFKNGE